MSRIGNKLIDLPENVTVKLDDSKHTVTVKGPKGELTRQVSPKIKITQEGNQLKFERSNENDKAIHGTTRANVNNMVIGVNEGFQKSLELVGVGYRAQKQGTKLVLNVGYSNPVEMVTPEGLTVDVPSNTQINISGISKQEVGQFAAEIRDVRPPEPYKGKGIKYVDEHIRRKEGKTGK
ncbi:50S ribosomal protein L6 [Bombilactobacillus bombi]|uniref:Large ribosomal subunit protein uL6 n=1 Tax=Bombilactobacillus bombi TaxID=1303590 RepID=A0A347SPY7_9LACO|nr:50S ribosomal protein L6 [Bombilactobacillus bombi]AXX64096.1 50S ribosomal protein L6 [Bombilactobacillus bombi]RHW47720.1 50S ribosomal protein L6 [Bombilactobacillus bombi]RHW51899.1 50S ribosomal protein L6 [Bombilactobacillus bombi]